jgi:hypothetical protein
MKPIKQYNLEGGCIEMASNGIIYIPSFMKIESGIQVILRVLPQQLERL